MTDHKPMPVAGYTTQRPRQAGRVRVTKKMINAGCEVYASYHPDSYWPSVDARVVRKIYQAMAKVQCREVCT